MMASRMPWSGCCWNAFWVADRQKLLPGGRRSCSYRFMKLMGYEPSLKARLSNESVNVSPGLSPKRPIASRSPCDALPNVVRLVARRTISLFVNVASVPPPPAIKTRTVQALVTRTTEAEVLRCWIPASTFMSSGVKA
jgi:hypothetical protein